MAKGKILIITYNDVEDVELLYPYFRLIEEGYEVHVASKSKGFIKGKHGYEIKVDITFDEVNPEEYIGLVIPGGRAPEKIRIIPRVIEIVKSFLRRNKPIAAICHGPQLLISANAVKGRRITSYIGIRDDVIAAGGIYEDKEVVVDGNIVTSRHPPDLPAFMREFLKLLSKY